MFFQGKTEDGWEKESKFIEEYKPLNSANPPIYLMVSFLGHPLVFLRKSYENESLHAM